MLTPDQHPQAWPPIKAGAARRLGLRTPGTASSQTVHDLVRAWGVSMEDITAGVKRLTEDLRSQISRGTP